MTGKRLRAKLAVEAVIDLVLPSLKIFVAIAM
jgi:hypothetical protein